MAYERRHRFRDVGRPGSAWLFGIAQKELAHWVRHRAAEQRAVRRLGIVVPALDDESIARIEALADVDAQRPKRRERHSVACNAAAAHWSWTWVL